MPVEAPLLRLTRSFARHLAAENKAPKTIETYGEVVDQFVTYLDATKRFTRFSRFTPSSWAPSESAA